MDTVDADSRKPKVAAAAAAPREPQPWRSAEDRRGWRVVGRGRGLGAPPPLITVEVALDAKQSAWVEAAAERAGVDYEGYIKALVDAARAAHAAGTGDEHGDARAPKGRARAARRQTSSR